MITGARPSGSRMLSMESGALIEGFKQIYDVPGMTYDRLIKAVNEAVNGGKCLGITRGGNHFVSEYGSKRLMTDGPGHRFKADFVRDGILPRIETTLLETSVQNLRRVMPASEVYTDSGGAVVIRERLTADANDYMESLTWVRERADGAIILFTLFNPMNAGGAAFLGEDRNEGEISVTFTGSSDGYNDTDYAPYELAVFERPGEV